MRSMPQHVATSLTVMAEGRLQVIKSHARPDWHTHLCQFPTASLCRTGEATRSGDDLIVHVEI
jgi:hypothetical protein